MVLLRKPWPWLLLIAVVAVGFAGRTLLAGRNPSHDIPTAEVVSGDFVMRLEEAGELRAKRSVTIAAPNDKLITYLAPEGSWVEEGDLLVQLESARYVIQVQEAQSELEVAQAQLDKALSELQAQKYNEESAKKAYEALLELQNKGFAMESEVDEAQLKYLETRSKTGSYEAAVNEKRSDVSRAENAMRQMQLRLESHTVYAPIAGLVVYASVGAPEEGKKIELGMTPFEGQALMQLPDIGAMQVVTEVNEVDIGKVEVGQPVEVRVDALPDAVFTGTVSRIGSLAHHRVSRATGTRSGVKVFSVEVDVENSDERLRPGLSATVSILVAKHTSVTYAPVHAIFEDEGDTVAFLKNGSKISRVVVECGGSNDDHVVIRSGLQAGDRVLLARPI